MRVIVPNPDCRVWIQGTLTEQRGTERLFVSPELASGNYSYQVKAAWMHNGREMTSEKRIDIRPGTESIVQFSADDAQDLSPAETLEEPRRERTPESEPPAEPVPPQPSQEEKAPSDVKRSEGNNPNEPKETEPEKRSSEGRSNDKPGDSRS